MKFEPVGFLQRISKIIIALWLAFITYLLHLAGWIPSPPPIEYVYGPAEGLGLYEEVYSCDLRKKSDFSATYTNTPYSLYYCLDARKGRSFTYKNVSYYIVSSKNKSEAEIKHHVEQVIEKDLFESSKFTLIYIVSMSLAFVFVPALFYWLFPMVILRFLPFLFSGFLRIAREIWSWLLYGSAPKG